MKVKTHYLDFVFHFQTQLHLFLALRREKKLRQSILFLFKSKVKFESAKVSCKL